MWSAVYGQELADICRREKLQRRNEQPLYVGLIKAVEPDFAAWTAPNS